jgi:hypothetical protein
LSRILLCLKSQYKESLELLERYENFMTLPDSAESVDNKKVNYSWKIFVEQFNSISTSKLRLEDDIEIEKVDKDENDDDLEDAALNATHNVKLRLQLKNPIEYDSLKELSSKMKGSLKKRFFIICHFFLFIYLFFFFFF